MAGGGEACADIEHLRSQGVLFGAVPSDSTLYRTFRQIDPSTLAGLWEGMAEVRAQVWRRAATTGTSTVVLDIDASLHQVHSENKVDAAPNYKGGYGFHPIYCFADATGETLGVSLRPGNAGANNIADHVAVLDQAVGQLPEEITAGHRPGNDPSLVRRAVQVRTDSAGCTGFVWHARARNIGFAVVARSNASIHAAISRVRFDGDYWQPALHQDGDERPGAAIAELTDLVDLSGWPAGTRLIVRREPLHPGAQQSLFPSTMFRYRGHYTDAAGDPVDLDVHMRTHTHVEDHIRRLKDSGAARFPFTDIDANRAWLAVVCFADALVRWFQHLCLTGPLAVAEPKTLRWRLRAQYAGLVGDVARTPNEHWEDGWRSVEVGRAIYEDDTVFARPDGEPTHPDYVSQVFHRHPETSEFPRIRLYDLRHTHATILLKAGVPVKVVSERLGYSSPAFTMTVYLHVLPGMQANAARAVSNAVFGANAAR